MNLRSAAFALAAAALALTWQAATVHANYGGNWSALFCTGERMKVPPPLAAGTFTFDFSNGYDGQFYRYLAHDPWNQYNYWWYLDAPRLRARRILVPALAWALAGGQPALADAACFAVILLAVALGAYWLGRYAVFLGRHPAWGLGFALLPATLISLDRMTVDVALAALCAGFVWYAARGSTVGLFVTAALAPLARETGILLAAAAVGHALWNRSPRRVVLFAAAGAPAAAWFLLASALAPAPPKFNESLVPFWAFQSPLLGLALKIFRPESYPLGRPLELLTQALDMAALCGVLLAVGMAVWSLRERRSDLEQWATLLFAGLILAVSAPDFWISPYGYGRPITPLLLLVALPVLRGGSWWRLAPMALVTARIALQFAPQVMGVAVSAFS